MSTHIGCFGAATTGRSAWQPLSTWSFGAQARLHGWTAFLARRPPVALAGGGAVSALLSSASDHLHWSVAIYIPGLAFGLVLAAGAYVWLTRSAPRLLAVVGGACLAWWAACQFTVRVAAHDDDQSLFALYGMAGGLVGSVITLAALSFAGRAAGSIVDAVRTIAVGTAAGLLLECLRAPSSSLGHASESAALSLLHVSSLLPLFLVWQVAVAASIGYGFGRR
jgi:hypothetical protein